MSGETFEVVFYCRCLEPPRRDYRIFVHGDPVSGDASRIHGPLPCWRRGLDPALRPGELVRDRFELTVPPDRPRGAFGVWTGLYIGGTRLSVADESETLHRDRVRGPEIRVVD